MKKKNSMVRKFTVGFIVLGILICSVTIGYGYFQYKSYIQKQYNTTAYQVAHVFESYMTEEEIADYIHLAEAYSKGEASLEDIEAVKNTEAYQRQVALLYDLREKMGANDIFMAYIDQDITNSFTGDTEGWKPMTYIFDCFMEEELKFEFGEQGKFNPKYLQSIQEIFATKAAVDNYYISRSEFGYNTYALEPVVLDGEVKGLVSVEIPMSTLESALMEYVMYSVIFTILLVAFFIALYMSYLYRKMVSPINLIASEAESFVENNAEISEKLGTIHTGDEIQKLGESVLQMEIGIKEYIANLTKVTAEKERIGAELNVAKQIQADMLPSIFPAFPEKEEFDIFATMEPAKEVGGDFYDFFLVDDDHLAFLIADVSGKGVPAALFMVIAKTLMKNHAQKGESPAQVFEAVNNQLCENNKEGMFVTAWMGILEISTGKLSYVNAGHNPPVVKGADGVFRYLHCNPDFVLAGMEGLPYHQGELQIAKGDSIYLYTDGVTEAINKEEELYGEERLEMVLNQHKEEAPEEILRAVKESIDTFAGEVEQFDDITMLCLNYKG